MSKQVCDYTYVSEGTIKVLRARFVKWFHRKGGGWRARFKTPNEKTYNLSESQMTEQTRAKLPERPRVRNGTEQMG